MKRHRTTARGILFLMLALLICTGSAAAFPPSAPSVSAAGKVPSLIFPVLGPVEYTDDFGDPRGQGAHEGNDLVAPKRSLALAAEPGRVEYHTTSSRAGCMLYLNGASGTQYLYIHLNNDLTLENDNRGKCVPGVAYAEGLKNGAKVTRRASRSATSATPATRTGSTRTSTSRCTRTGAAASAPTRTSARLASCSSRRSPGAVHARAHRQGRRPPPAEALELSDRPGAPVAGRADDRSGWPEGRGLDAGDRVARGASRSAASTSPSRPSAS